MIYGDRVYLRRFTKEDIPAHVSWDNDWEVIKYATKIYGTTIEDATESYDRIRNAHSLSVNFAIVIKETDKFIGSISLSNIRREKRNAEIAIMIGEKDEWNKGYGEEAMRLMLEFGFNQMNLHRIYLYVCALNKAAIKCYEKIGFKNEGILREHWYIDGRYEDDVVMGILKDEFIGQSQ